MYGSLGVFLVRLVKRGGDRISLADVQAVFPLLAALLLALAIGALVNGDDELRGLVEKL